MTRNDDSWDRLGFVFGTRVAVSVTIGGTFAGSYADHIDVASGREAGARGGIQGVVAATPG